MEFSNTIQAMQNLGKAVVEEGKLILATNKPYPKTTSKNTLYNDFSYTVTTDNDNVELEWSFGNAEDYWRFVDEGVKGSGKPDKNGYLVPGSLRGVGSPFSYSNKMPPRRAIDKWVVRKPLKAARDKKGRFIKRKSLVFFIQRSIFQRGLQRTQFFTKSYNDQLNQNINIITEAFADDLEANLEILLK
tara:strand:+ start:407 stop:970 length:564 start_codon:yes stop_codon:yes gene_type:complete